MEKQMLKSRLPPIPAGDIRSTRHRQIDYTPVDWKGYFDQQDEITVGNDRFHVYKSGKSGPVLLFLHGGGFSGLTWALLSTAIQQSIECRCVALDFRAHGESKCADENDLSTDTLTNDVGNVVTALFGDEAPPPVVLIGHSMGGAIGVDVAHRGIIPSLTALVVIDVVEGTACEALGSMRSFLGNRPRAFESLERAIEWSLKTGQIRNIDSAKVSVIGQLKSIDSGSDFQQSVSNQSNIIAEETEEEAAASNHEVPAQTNKYTWRLDLMKTEQFWKGWFTGLSKKFLGVPVPKMLLLAGVDRLDKDLTIGQMQGKFQMKVLPKCGHCVHEDVPDEVAEILVSFLKRHKLV
ncbi:protein phosphatase methylesterase 1-like [Tubulanus polymorphus]|uniref:protein phosphatase methylesterase 1-like n=1 Tax=Tubulanus polymorphus TaxID=672921 RepID=UPI003DA6B1FD